ncbi:PFL_4669 family integrating conjugative element protein [Providencia hangzhouensis]|uniref:Integrating conjugative element protein, PFL_4669 family n=1 Tax=Providencia rettgeri TaxID=587 RepID=A0A9N8D370_PRORE|nr:TIGR03761 family integrating conjugative element protein [Providencia rettgeri]UPQ40159.1 TIGR03761 family integrating conjugative element protein [Providencia rettgeri]CAB5649645.1 integrating conjugative element protein, PFL_4669 family [Providencia rettgeri]CAB5688652.1 integrating conjugative element protein, PFL_4669 family [Providencia rettgeri]CAC9189450.1 integrating conjugative element protein, PFL_4669 family [Providencia rettgeri]CAC9223930.1 integrating conjugative element prote
MTPVRKQNENDAEIPDKERRAGPLKSQLKLTLHTDFAIQLWHGRRQNDKSNSQTERHWQIPGVPLFLASAARVSNDALKGLLFAEWWLYKLEQILDEGTQHIQQRLENVENKLKVAPASVKISDISSTVPVNLGVFSKTPIGYRCVWLLVGVDQLVLRVLQAYHYGLLSRKLRSKYLDDACHQVRRALGMSFKYRQILIHRGNLDVDNDAYRQAVTYFGELDPDIVSGKKRSSFLPPLKKITVLKGTSS